MPLHAQQPCEEAHLPFEPPFSCIPRRIDAASGGSIIAGCADQIRLCVGKPLAPRHPDAPDSGPVRLYRILGDPASEPVYVERPLHWYPDTVTGSIVVTPDPPLESAGIDPTQPAVFRLVTDCRFWNGRDHDGVDTSFIDLWKQHVVRVQGAAHRLHDGVSILEEVVVTPVPSVSTSFTANGVALAAENTERYRFDHWSCSVDLDGFDPRRADQQLMGVCWPLEDTVLFTAWYRDATAGVPTQDRSAIRASISDGSVRVVSDGAPIMSVAVTDIQGRLHAWRSTPELPEIAFQMTAPPGFYFVVVRTRASTTTLPLLYSP